MAVHGPFSFDISFVKIGQEIKLLEHLNFFFITLYYVNLEQLYLKDMLSFVVYLK
jgi:hypothetical protein